MKVERVMFALNFAFSLITMLLVVYAIVLLWNSKPVVVPPVVEVPTPTVVVSEVEEELTPSQEATPTAKPTAKNKLLAMRKQSNS